MKLNKRSMAAVGIAAVVLVSAAWLLWCFPRPLFRYSASLDGLSIFSDDPFDPADGRMVLEGVRRRLGASPLYRPHDRHAVYICNASWHRRLFFIANPQAGGLNYYPITTNVFLSGARIAENRLVSPTGRIPLGDRTLDYFIAHEIGHTLTGRAVGFIQFLRLAPWAKEGYAEYAAKGPVGAYDRAAIAFLAETREMNEPRAAPYLRYRFLVTHFLDRKRWAVLRVLESTMSGAEVEALVRRDLLKS